MKQGATSRASPQSTLSKLSSTLVTDVPIPVSSIPIKRPTVGMQGVWEDVSSHVIPHAPRLASGDVLIMLLRRVIPLRLVKVVDVAVVVH